MGTGLCKLEKETRVVCCLFVKVLTLIQKKKNKKKQNPKNQKPSMVKLKCLLSCLSGEDQREPAARCELENSLIVN